jgi:hypothetical protein
LHACGLNGRDPRRKNARERKERISSTRFRRTIHWNPLPVCSAQPKHTDYQRNVDLLEQHNFHQQEVEIGEGNQAIVWNAGINYNQAGRGHNEQADDDHNFQDNFNRDSCSHFKNGDEPDDESGSGNNARTSEQGVGK